jgi:hypothetical protein
VYMPACTAGTAPLGSCDAGIGLAQYAGAFFSGLSGECCLLGSRVEWGHLCVLAVGLLCQLCCGNQTKESAL